MVSDAPFVDIVYFRDSVGWSTKSACSPMARSVATDWKGCRTFAFALAGGYHLSAHSLSAFDSTAGGMSPLRSYFSGKSIRPGPNSYSMMESGSQADP